MEACKKMDVTPNSQVKMQFETGAQAPKCKAYDFSLNLLGDRGALPVVDAIDKDNTFTKLSFRRNNLRNTACSAITRMLRKHDHVVELDLRGNFISVTGGQELYKLACEMSNLKIIRLENNRIDAHLRLKIQSALGVEVDFDDCSMDNEPTPLLCRLMVLDGVGSGTSELCEALAGRFDLVHIRASACIAADGNVAAQELVDFIHQQISAANASGKGWIVDGFPSVVSQAEALGGTADAIPDILIKISISADDLLERVRNRRVDPDTGTLYDIREEIPTEIQQRLEPRDEDTEANARASHEELEKNVSEIIEYQSARLQAGGSVLEVNGDATVKAMCSKIETEVTKMYDAKEEAATKIQSIQRGKQARAEVTEMSSNAQHVDTKEASEDITQNASEDATQNASEDAA